MNAAEKNNKWTGSITARPINPWKREAASEVVVLLVVFDAARAEIALVFFQNTH